MSRRNSLFFLAAILPGAVAIILIARPTTMKSESSISPSSANRSEQEAKWQGDKLLLSSTTVNRMQLECVHPIESRQRRELRLTGNVSLDPNRLVHVTSRFPGEVVAISNASGQMTPIGIGQQVEKGELLAVVWSKEIGEKKSDLVDALSQKYLHETIYRRLSKIDTPGAVAQRSIDEIQRTYESDLILVERLRRTLESWRVPKQEIEKIESESLRIHQLAMQSEPKSDWIETHLDTSSWANVEIRSPISGVVLERNLTVGDMVGTDDDLFKIADISQYKLIMNLYEDDLDQVLRMRPEDRVWQVRLRGWQESDIVEGRVEVIGSVIDPNQHTVVLQGSIENPLGKLRVGQFVEATMKPPLESQSVTANTWEIPLSALIDLGDKACVVLSDDQTMTQLRPEQVRVIKRTAREAVIESTTGAISDQTFLLSRGALELSSLMPLSELPSRSNVLP